MTLKNHKFEGKNQTLEEIGGSKMLQKKMSKIFGTSSDDEEISFKNKVDLQQLHESDSDKASNASGPRLKSKKVKIFYMTFWLGFFQHFYRNRVIILFKFFDKMVNKRDLLKNINLYSDS